MTVPPRRPTSTHYSGPALNDPSAPLPALAPTRPNGAPLTPEPPYQRPAPEPQGIPKGIKVDREGPQPDELEGRYDPMQPLAFLGKEPRPMEGKMEIIVRARIGEDRTGGSTWAIDRSRLASFLRTVPREGSTIHAYMEDLNEHGDLQALCLEAAWTPEDKPRPDLMARIAEYQANNFRTNVAEGNVRIPDPGGLY